MSGNWTKAFDEEWEKLLIETGILPDDIVNEFKFFVRSSMLELDRRDRNNAANQEQASARTKEEESRQKNDEGGVQDSKHDKGPYLDGGDTNNDLG